MPFQPGQSGNPNGQPKWVKPWRDAIRLAIARREQDNPHAIVDLAEKLLKAVDGGDVSAMKEFGDRVDGKVAQPVGGADDLPPQQHTHKIERLIVDIANPDSEGVQAPAGPIPV